MKIIELKELLKQCDDEADVQMYVCYQFNLYDQNSDSRAEVTLNQMFRVNEGRVNEGKLTLTNLTFF